MSLDLQKFESKILIYKITNIINKDYYVGQTIQGLETRFKQHIYQSINRSPEKKTYLENALFKYKKENFIIEIIDSANSFDESNLLEQFWISYYKYYSNYTCYNLTEGGWNHSLTDKIITKMKLTTKQNFYKLNSKTSKFKGVYFYKNRNKWISRIILDDGKTQHLGCFLTENEAGIAYNDAVDRYSNGKNWYKNFIKVE